MPGSCGSRPAVSPPHPRASTACRRSSSIDNARREHHHGAVCRRICRPVRADAAVSRRGSTCRCRLAAPPTTSARRRSASLDTGTRSTSPRMPISACGCSRLRYRTGDPRQRDQRGSADRHRRLDGAADALDQGLDADASSSTTAMGAGCCATSAGATFSVLRDLCRQHDPVVAAPHGVLLSLLCGAPRSGFWPAARRLGWARRPRLRRRLWRARPLLVFGGCGGSDAATSCRSSCCCRCTGCCIRSRWHWRRSSWSAAALLGQDRPWQDAAAPAPLAQRRDQEA